MAFKNSLLLLILMFNVNTYAQIDFEEHVVLDLNSAVLWPLQVHSVDIDNDGDMDLLSASAYDNKIAWYENTNGLGSFGPQKIISTSLDYAGSVYAADLDDDGDMDVLSSSWGDDKIAWYENTDGEGTFGAQQVISTNAGTAYSVYASDIDGDGDIDVLSASRGDNKIAWYENIDGLGSFSNERIIAITPNMANSVYASDLDGDGDMDVLSGSSWGEIAWYRNTDGEGAFDNAQVITADIEGSPSVITSDLDGDGDLDVLITSEHESKIAWFENTNGLGTFGTQQVITTNQSGILSIFSTDLDNDGDMDVLGASNVDDKLAWYENTDGEGTFGAQQIINSSTDGACSIYASDIDGDGDMDAISASRVDDKISWYENTDGEGTFGIQQNILTSANGACSVYAADLDGDSDLDMLSASWKDDKIAWYENTVGEGTFGTQQIISPSAEEAKSVFAADLDGDGDMDVLSASENDDKIAWYENTNGLGIFGLHHIISTNADAATSVYSADLDNDGDMDVLSASIIDDKIAWYENLDGEGNFSTQNIITTIADKANSVYAADIDSDGNLDVLSASIADGKIAWYKNMDGEGNFGAQQLISQEAGAFCVYASDIDGDGDMDVLSSSVFNVVWYENLDGLGTFYRHLITDDINEAQSVYASDIDGDGTMDVLFTTLYANEIVVYRNIDGQGTFIHEVISSNAMGAKAVFAGDINGDGAMDVLSASEDDDKIAWYENLGPLGIDENTVSFFSIYPNPIVDVFKVESQSRITKIEIYNPIGQLIKAVYDKNSVDTSRISPGLYIIKIIDENGHTETKKGIVN